MCDSVVVVADGRVLLAKNSDRDSNEAQLLEWHPAGTHAPGATVRCTWIEIPQAPDTQAILISRPFWMWGAEMGANAAGVAIGNEAVFTTQPYAENGLTGMDLVRLALERAATAAEAVSVVTDLLERHAQGGGCGHERPSFTYHSSFLIADPTEAWVLETAGRKWAAEQIRTGTRSISNGLTIPAFAAAHSDPVRTTVSACRVRRELTSRAAARNPTLAGLFAALRSHGDGRWPYYSPVNGGMAAPCMHAAGLVTASQTTASWVSDLRPGRDAIHWATATAAPCTSLFKPFRVAQPVSLGPPATDRFDERCMWWRHERLHRVALRDPARALPLFTGERDEIERAWLAEVPDAELAVARGDDLLARWTAAVSAAVWADVRPAWVRHHWRVRDRRAGIWPMEVEAA